MGTRRWKRPVPAAIIPTGNLLTKMRVFHSIESVNIPMDRRQHPAKPIAAPLIVVSGLPRSGTSMMMKMLEAAGVPLLTDERRKPDDDNPEGYYELERVKKIPAGDCQWLFDARGKAVKIISSLLIHLPPELPCKIIFMRRNLSEVLASQHQMLIRRGESPLPGEDEKILPLFQKHLAHIETWIQAQPLLEVIYIEHRDVLRMPEKVGAEIAAFLGRELDPKAMAAVVNRSLYRQRTP